MVMLCGLAYNRTVKKQSGQLSVTIMNKIGGHPAAFDAAVA
jgi:hypothetical protein